MRYLETFHRRLRQLRDNRGLSLQDVAEICGVDHNRVAAWEAKESRHRGYPDVSELIDLAVQTSTTLEELLDLEDAHNHGQLELPGLAFSNDEGLQSALKELEEEIGRLQLSGEEIELLRRFRKASGENRRMVLQIMGR